MRLNNHLFATTFAVACLSSVFLDARKEEQGKGFLSRLKKTVSNPTHTLSQYKQVAHIMRNMLQLPYILTVDSTSPSAVRASAVANALAVTSKSGWELFRTDKNNSCLAARMIFDMPKVTAYSVASVYDIVRFLEARNIALQNAKENSSGNLRGFKLNQLALWVTEVLLRVASQMSMNRSNADEKKDDFSGWMVAQIADGVEMWRLISRFNSYFSPSKIRADLKLVVNREELVDDDLDDDVKEYAQLTEENLKLHNKMLSEEPIDDEA